MPSFIDRYGMSLDEMPMSRTRWLITAMSSMGMFMDGYVLTIFSAATILPISIKSVFAPTTLEWGLMGAAALVGMFIGASTFGNLADRFGRKRMYTYDLLLTAVFLLLTAFSRNWLEFFIFQLFAGVGIGADYPISSSIQSEFSPRRKRGFLLVLNIFMWTIGSIVFLFASIPLYYSGAIAWQLMYATAAVIPLLVITLRSRLPESPRWLLLKGRRKQAENAVLGLSKELGKSAVSLVSGIRVEKGKSSFRELFSKSYATMIAFTTIAWFSYDVASYGVWTYTPYVFSSTGTSYALSILGDLLEEVPVFIGFAFCILLVERLGRKPLQAGGFLGAGISLVIFASYAYVIKQPPFAVMFIAFALMHVFHNLGPTNLTYAYPAEIFPTRLRGTAHGFATAMSRIGGVLGIVAFPVLLAAISMWAALLFFAAFEFVGFAVTYKYAPETMGKKLV